MGTLSNHRGLLSGAAFLALMLGGCGLPSAPGVPGGGPAEGITPAVDTENSAPDERFSEPPAKGDAMPWARRVVDLPLKSRGMATRPGGDRCEQRCGDDAGCAILCLQGEMDDRAEGDPRGEDCLVCGRETGFLPKPRLRVGDEDASGVWLEWDVVPGATEYVLHGLRWTEEGPQGSLEYRTRETKLYVPLEADFFYSFYVVAWDTAGKRRSPPSAPVRVDP